MRRVIVMNAKGGSGKTTVATNLASAYAARGFRTALIDYDPQGSSLQWLRGRATELPPIQGVAVHEASRVPLAGAWQMRIARDTQRVVVDTAAGIRAIDLCGRLGVHDQVLIPIQPSAIDIRATADFVRDLLLVAKLRPQDGRLALVGNRTRRHTNSYEALQRFLDTLKIPVLAHLRDSQNYLLAAERGIGVVELAPPQARAERAHWQTILDWAERGSEDVAVATVRPGSVVPAPGRPAAVPAFLTRSREPERDAPSLPVAAKTLN